MVKARQTTRRTASQDRGRKTQSQIIEGASAVFEEQEYSAASLEDIKEASGVSQGSMYFHFKRKEQIALAIIQEQHNRIYAGVDPAIADHADPLIRLMAISKMICEQLRTDSVVRAGINLALGQGSLREASARSYATWVDGVGQLLGKLDRDGMLNSDIPVDRLSASLVSHFTGGNLMSQAMTQRADMTDYISTMWRVFINAAIAEAHRERYKAELDSMFGGFAQAE
ncbi:MULTISPECIES: ScbR family autoregulator-binding transcription factor [Brevibacterium]|uniref:Transcriptional regulator, TetR family n=2 Tax=Brevibacterium TaxID=1696 RepID=A0A2H1K6Y8_BRELN|nr:MULTISPECIES: ScbR family autoregulator-binding transcription factor [Brevibacterium]SMX69975.1 transcriptional regulator, TetR family [Brevibacterium antiquum]SMX95419.1 transcriptional regulator, TetR family [Brevibacterium linens ATCC 9172]